jgi:hypothetical protein
MRVKLLSLFVALAWNGGALAKGLEELGQSNPETQASEGEEKAAAEGEEGENKAAPQPPGALSQTLAEKLYMATSFGWVSASKSDGEWKSSGMSDFQIGYLVMKLNAQMSVHGTFRYAPIAVSGEQESHLYRGVWEVYNFGGRFNYRVSPTILAVGTGELGYVKADLNAVDGLEPIEDHQAGGAMLSVGGGADFALTEKGSFSAGPRLYAGFGSYSAIQLSAAASFLF